MVRGVIPSFPDQSNRVLEASASVVCCWGDELKRRLVLGIKTIFYTPCGQLEGVGTPSNSAQYRARDRVGVIFGLQSRELPLDHTCVGGSP